VVTAILPSQDTGLSTAKALAAVTAGALVGASVEASVEEGVSDEALVHGLAGAGALAGGDITLTGEDPMGPLMGPHTLARIPQAPRMR